MTDLIKNAAATVTADLKAFRSTAVTSENKSNVSARSMLAALVSGVLTPALAESAVIVAFGNPKSPKSGKPVAKLSGLRDFTGGDAVRKMTETCFRIFANIDADKPVSVASDTDGEPDMIVGAGAIRPLVVGFILETEGSPKSLRALNEAVSAALRVHAKAISPDNTDAANETDAETADNAPKGESGAFDPADAIAKLAVFASGMGADDANRLSDAMNALYAAWDARCNVLTDADADTAPEALAA